MTDILGKFIIDDTLDADIRRPPPSRRRRPREDQESDVRTECRAKLDAAGYCIVKHQAMFAIEGTPDLIACVRGRMVVVELKRPGKTPTAAQLGQLRAWQDAGALAGWVDSGRRLDDLLDHVDDPAWRNDFALPGDGRQRGEPW